MKIVFLIISYFASCILLTTKQASAQSVEAEKASNFQEVNTYVNPVLPGDHPDPTLLKVGDDFYHCGSSFHFTPYLPIYHSTDLVHWRVISRVIPPAKGKWVTDRPSAGIWQGAITNFYGSFWIYFSAGGQWFSKAASPYGPWSDPVKVTENPITGPLGYDNSIFVDDDGKPYMVIKNGQKVNRIQALGRDGQLTDSVINLDWLNAKLQYSWAEGPVMCKRNGIYYYFPAGDVSGGQYVLKTKKLTSDSTYWERLGNFFSPITDSSTGFRRPNHISAPFQLGDGSWWTIGQSYEKYDKDDWSGLGRQTSLYSISWEDDRPWGTAPTTLPIKKPALSNSGILWRSVEGDDFDSDKLGLQWHFLSKKAFAQYSLTAKKGWLRLSPDSNRTHLVQKETDHYYTAITKLEFDPTDTAKAGIYLTNGNQKVVVKLYSGNDHGRKIIFSLDTAVRVIDNPFGTTLWLKIQRKQHTLSAWCSGDGNKWIAVGDPINSKNLDKVQPNYNSWVGTSIGLFAEGKSADFDFFICKDAFSTNAAIGYSNYYGVETVKNNEEASVTNISSNGGWMMISGMETGKKQASRIALNIAATAAGELEIWQDDLKDGKLLTTITVKPTGSENKWKTYSKAITSLIGHHDIFIKFPTGDHHKIFVRDILFLEK